MKERPILFSGPMVRAILDSTKTQTRSVLRPQPPGSTTDVMTWHHPDDERKGAHFWSWGPDPANPGRDYIQPDWAVPCPYGQPGDRLWVRETFSGPWCMEAQDGAAAAPPSKWAESSRIWYWADGEPAYGDWTRPRPSIHMPRWASRITLEITSVRVETLGITSHEDALAEGVSSIEEYRALWININGAWLPETWVWVLEFCRINSKEIEHAAE